MKQQMLIGNPHEVKQRLRELQAVYKADEMMINTITYAPYDRINSYRLLMIE